MIAASMNREPAAPKPPIASVAALAAALMLPALVLFVGSSAGRALYRAVFEPLYTAGMVLGMGAFALTALAIAAAGWLAAVAAWQRRESPVWLRVTAIAATIIAPLGTMAYLGLL
jgi:hypothetical protein